MIVFDAEADGLYPSKFWCLSKRGLDGDIKTTTSYKAMRKFLKSADVLIGHNVTRWDTPQLERVLGIKIKAKLVDTLILSWYLYPNRVLHGLEAWGEEFGVPKPEISNWENLTVSDYKHRCEEDVKINGLLWDKMWSYLKRLYGSEDEAWRLIDYLSFKFSVARQQEEVRWKLDVGRCESLLESFSKEIKEKVDGLAMAMPKVPEKASKSFPKKFYKMNGDVSAEGNKWSSLCEQEGLPLTHKEDIEYVKSFKEPNPNSTPQIKSWLYSLGWQPETFKYVRNKETGDVRKIEQVNKPHGGGVCPSIKRLECKEPSLELLDGLSILTHRLSIVKGFLSNVDDEGYVQAQVQGLTNTLRWKHKVCVNLPGVDKPYGEDIRGCLIAPRGYRLCGSDMAALEDRTKQHYMWPHDPDYVKKMMEPGYCPHVDIAVLAGMLTEEQGTRHKTKEFLDKGDEKTILAGRKEAKPVNYGGVYGQKPKGLAQSSGMPLRKAEKLYKIYWERNWSVEAIAAEQIVKVCNKQKWLYNPVSKLWYSLRNERDKFSTLNQGTGVWCFDTWVKYQVEAGLLQVGQFHDETVNLIKEGDEEITEKKLRWAIDQTNKELSLNRELDIDVQFGYNYSQIH